MHRNALGVSLSAVVGRVIHSIFPIVRGVGTCNTKYLSKNACFFNVRFDARVKLLQLFQQIRHACISRNRRTKTTTSLLQKC